MRHSMPSSTTSHAPAPDPVAGRTGVGRASAAEAPAAPPRAFRRGAPRIVYAVTTPRVAWWFLRGQLAYLRERGAEVHLVASPEPSLRDSAEREGVTPHPLAMDREIAPRSDLRALVALWRLLRRLRPDIVNASTPKAGLLAALAARLAGVPQRVYVLRGLRLETTRGVLRRVLWLAEWLACRSATRVVCVSPSLRERAVELRLVAPRRAVVIGDGSSNGIDVARFAASPELRSEAARLRRSLGLGDGAEVVGFVGRFTRDKGLVELAEAFARLRRRRPEARLLLVGDFEDGDPVPDATRRLLEEDGHVIRTGWVPEVAPYLHLCDVVALPTHREGFPNIAVEAAAAGKPVVTTDATGARDAVVDGETGLVVPVADAAALTAALERLLAAPEWARRLGEAGHRRAVESFQPERIWRGLLELYVELYDGPAASGGARPSNSST